MPIAAPVTREDRQAASAVRKKETRNRVRTVRRAEHVTEFIAVDGEGMTVWPVDSEGVCHGPRHVYVLLGVGQRQLENPAGLHWKEILDFLWEEYVNHPGAAFVGFYLGYDFTQWLKTLPENRASILLTKGGRAARQRKLHQHNGPFPVYCDDWEFDILGVKRFKFRPKGQKSWMYICDAGPFFQASLMSIIDPGKWTEPVVTEEEWATLQEGKAKRSTAVLDADMRRYNRLENDVLARLMVRLNEGFTDAGIRLRKNQWYGPGAAAQEWMKSTDLPTHEQLEKRLPWQALSDLRATYYGGWFEIFMHGHVPGISWEYDINSAYPFIASELPCLMHGKWEHRNGLGETREYKGKSVPKDFTASYFRWTKVRNQVTDPVLTSLPPLGSNELRAVYAHVRGSDRHIGTMLHRRQADGISIVRPDRTTGWFWQHELEAAQQAGIIDTIECIEWWTYTKCDCRPPMRGLAGLYDKRLRVGKNTSAGKSYKLIYNSVYGKNAQTIGDPRFGNLIYASLITAGCRTMILDAIATHPGGTSAVAMVATDGVYFTSPHPNLPQSEKIGDWECSQKNHLTLFKPGVYWDDKARADIREGKAARFKARGVNAAAFGKQIATLDGMFTEWDGRYPETEEDWPSVQFAVGFSMVTALQALQRGKWWTAGYVSDSNEAWQYSTPEKYGKRASGYYDGEVYRSTPCTLPPHYENGRWERSVPYTKGMTVSETHGDNSITPDGTIVQTVSEMLGLVK